ncbi:MAG: right-handed parallel beta-helix repeat-containing protein [bacterium]
MRTFSILYSFMTLFLVILFFFPSCRKKDQLNNDPSLILGFSSDTVYFDTVFTTVGSVTQRLLVYNRNKNKVSISSVRLAGGESSNYSININGIPSSYLGNVEIPGEDSIYIFVRVTIDPNNKNTPFVVSDSLLFITNGNFQQVKLVAWGQNAFFYKNEHLTGDLFWDSLKAHVIYGVLNIDSGSTLTMLPGTKIYFHQKSSLSIAEGSRLMVYGASEHPVQFTGDRLDPYYRDLPGQWDGIFLEKGSTANEINYGIIRNGKTGIGIFSGSISGQTDLKLDNTVIQNMTGDGILTESSSLVSTNCIVGNCGGSAVAITGGGSYDFRQLTIGNYWSGSVRTSPSLYLSNFVYDTLGNKIPFPLLKAYFGNSIIYGNSGEELMYDSVSAVSFEYTFDHCLLRTEKDLNDPLRYINCFANEDPRFVNPQLFDYMIDSISPVIDKGIPIGVPFDIRGVDRGSTPDLGAFEYVKHR